MVPSREEEVAGGGGNTEHSVGLGVVGEGAGGRSGSVWGSGKGVVDG